MRRSVVVTGAVLVAAAAGVAFFGPWREPGADRQYGTEVADPKLSALRPQVLFDHGHRNIHSASGRYGPFAALIAADGCRVRQIGARLDSKALAGADILVIVNAKGPSEDPTQSAFTDAECDAVHDYVQQGGALLLVADHHPCGEAASNLAARFGVQMSGGWTDDSTHARVGSGDPGQLLFTKADGQLGAHPILQGVPDAPIDTVETFTGQSLLGPSDSSPLLILSASSMDRVPVSSTVQHQGSKRITTFETADHSAAGRVQGLALRSGRGRVVMLGEAAMLTAQKGDRGGRFGMNSPGNDNRNFTLNVVRWLAGALDEPAVRH